MKFPTEARLRQIIAFVAARLPVAA